MAVPLFYWVLFWDLLCFCIRDVTCLCNITCTTDYSEYLECECANAPSSAIGLEAICRDQDNNDPMEVLSSCELRPPQSSCQMHPENFSDIISTDTNCTVTVIDPLGPPKDPLGPSTDPLGPPTARGVESGSWALWEIVKTLPPSNLRVTQRGGSVNLTWEVDNYQNICLRYRVRIRDPTQVRIFEELNQYLEIPASVLLPAHRSQADVQACPSPENYLDGPWSAWSPAVDLTEVHVPAVGESRLVLCVAVPALLCVIAFCYFSKPFFMKKVQFLMFIPDPSPFFKSLHDKYDGNFKEWVHPAFSEADVLRVAPAPAPVPASDRKLLLLSHRGSHIRGDGGEEEEEEEEEDGGGGGGFNPFPGFLSLHTVVLSGGECDGRGGAGGAGLPAWSAEDEGGDPPRAPPLAGGPAADPWDDNDYPRVDLDTVDSGFGESACSSPVFSEDAAAPAEAGFFPPDDHGGKSDYVRQWMIDRQRPPPPAGQPHPPPPAYQNLSYQAPP